MALRLADPYSISDKAARKLAAKLALRGHSVVGAFAPSIRGEWSVYCDAPVEVRRAVRAGGGRRSLEMSFPAPCRKCEKCQRFRRMRWRQRIINEILLAPGRTWFLTLTFAPVHLAGVLLEARAYERAGKTQAEAIETAAYDHVQRYLKRLRKNTRTKFRYIAVPEYGETHGRLHYHLLVHEVERPILKRSLQAAWRGSFSSAKLVEEDTERGVAGAASYVAKYLAKSGGRVRASLRYGALSPETEKRPSSRALF